MGDFADNGKLLDLTTELKNIPGSAAAVGVIIFLLSLLFTIAQFSRGFPKSLHWKNFIDARNSIQIGQGFINTLTVCAGTVFFTVPVTSVHFFSSWRLLPILRRSLPPFLLSWEHGATTW